MSTDNDGEYELNLTRHAKVRMRQRGKRMKSLELVFQHHDFTASVGGGCRAVQLSSKQTDELISEGYTPQEIDAAAKTTLILTADDAIVTIYPGPSRRRRLNALQDYARRHQRWKFCRY